MLAEYGKTKYVSLIFLIYHICVSFPLFHFSLSQSAYIWWFDSNEAFPDGLQVRSPCSSQAQTFLRPLERGERGGAAAAPAGRELPQEARAARSWREAKVVLSRVLAEYGKTKYVSLILLIYCIYVFLFTVSI